MTPARLTPIMALAATLVCCASSQAAFAPFTLVSGDPALHLQASYAYDPAVSEDGSYVAYAGTIASQPGIYRTYINPITHSAGETVPVALGEDTGAPSISASGRYISFTTNDNPETGKPAGECYSVYVRDMGKQPHEAGAYTLVSAGNDSGESLTYGEAPAYQSCGAASASRVAISSDGSKVAFTVLSPSSLTGPCTTAATPVCPTPPDQVAVRDRETQETTLVSVTLASLGATPQPVPSGAAIAGQIEAPRPAAASTAAISADGSTVAWMGINIAQQAPVAAPLPTGGFVDGYAEPLWRRIGEGPSAPTRRVLAGDDPSAPGCPPACSGGLNLEWEGQNVENYVGTAPEFGSYAAEAGSADGWTAHGASPALAAVTPQLSENGMSVALLSTQPDFARQPVLASRKNAPTANAFVVNMAPGLTRAQAITRLTEWGGVPFGGLLGYENAAIQAIAISPDGSRVAFTTARTYFPLAPPALVTAPVSKAEFAQLYEANLTSNTLALVSQGYNGEPGNSNSYGVALSGTGETLALASAAGNLSFGAVNEGSDVFLTHEEESPDVGGVQELTDPPPGPEAPVKWGLSATETQSADGALLIDVGVPGAGSLTASASASVPTTETVVIHAKRATRARKAQVRRISVIATRQVAHASAKTEGVELVRLRLDPAASYRSLTYADPGLFATITLTFTAHGHPRVSETVQASFHTSPLYKFPVYKLPRPKPKPKRVKRRPARRR